MKVGFFNAIIVVSKERDVTILILFELDETTINQLAKSSELVLSCCQLDCTHKIDCDILQNEDECRALTRTLQFDVFFCLNTLF